MIKPNNAETFERFAIRAHRQLQSQVMDPDQRNELIEQYWRQSRGPTTAAEARALQRFGKDEWTHKPGVCVFTEHSTTDSMGQPRQYGLRELAEIVRSANERIEDVDAFPAISDGHTSDEPGANPPNVLGYVGNYRLGMIGRKNPKWAIFADEYHQKGEPEQTLKRKPRRSVELWSFPDNRGSFFDPIAALGSEAPRLALPTRFKMASAEQCQRYHMPANVGIERYRCSTEDYAGEAGTPVPAAAATGALPGGSNTHLKDHADLGMGPEDLEIEPEQYGADDMPAGLNDTVAEFMAAIQETPQWQWLTEKMNADARATNEAYEAEEEQEEATDDLEGLDDMPDMPPEDFPGDEMPPEPEAEAPPAEPPAMPDQDDEELSEFAADEDTPPPAPAEGESDDPLADLADLLETGDGEGMPADEAPPEPEDEDEVYMGRHSQTNGETAALQRYAQQLERVNGEQSKQLQQQGERLRRLERDAIDDKRRGVIAQLAGRYALDEDAELKECLLSKGSKMTNAQFRERVNSIQRYSMPAADRVATIPQGTHDGPAPSTVTRPTSPEQYAQVANDMAVRICKEARSRGETPDYDTALTQAKKDLGPAPR